MKNDQMITKRVASSLLLDLHKRIKYLSIGSIVSVFLVFALPNSLNYIIIGLVVVACAVLLHISEKEIKYLEKKYELGGKPHGKV